MRGHFSGRTLQSGPERGFRLPSHSQECPSSQLGPHHGVIQAGPGVFPFALQCVAPSCKPPGTFLPSLAVARLAAFQA